MAYSLDLSGRVALVTGASSGLGEQFARTLASAGAAVVLASRRVDRLKSLRTDIEAQGGDAHVVSLDVTDLASIEAAVAYAETDIGPIDILINNVGQSEPGGPVEMSEETWDGQMDLNVKTAFLTMKSVLPIMENQGSGSIISISSVAGLRYVGKPQVAYAAGKAALMQLTKTTAVLYASKGIRLNCVVPGLVFTPLVKRLADKYAGGQFEAFVEHRHKQVPAGHMGDAWDVAHTVLFLASDESRYITAQSIVVDGGLIAATR
jgi:NAD(P)-dependent dehydrogenase (short-subunit alcohol dehydrogenase family)